MRKKFIKKLIIFYVIFGIIFWWVDAKVIEELKPDDLK